MSTLPVRPGLEGAAPYGAPELDVPVRLNVNENPYAPSGAVVDSIAPGGQNAALFGALSGGVVLVGERAARTPGLTVIRNASGNYMVQDLCFFLRELGVGVEGIGSFSNPVVRR